MGKRSKFFKESSDPKPIAKSVRGIVKPKQRIKEKKKHERNPSEKKIDCFLH